MCEGQRPSRRKLVGFIAMRARELDHSFHLDNTAKLSQSTRSQICKPAPTRVCERRPNSSTRMHNGQDDLTERPRVCSPKAAQPRIPPSLVSRAQLSPPRTRSRRPCPSPCAPGRRLAAPGRRAPQVPRGDTHARATRTRAREIVFDN